MPADYRIGIVPASDTGAVEMALWSLLGARPVDVLAWESFGEGWVTDVVKQLKLEDVRVLEAAYGELPDLAKVDRRNATSSSPGTARPRACACRTATGSPPTAQGLTICDATSAAFAQELAWAKLDVVTFSWQKVLGGEAAHGMLILSPRAVAAAGELQAGLAAAEDLPPDQGRQAHRGHLRGRDHQHAVDAVRRGLPRRARLGEGGRRARRPDRPRRRQRAVIADWVARTPWVDFLAQRPGDALQHLGLPEDRRPGGRRLCRRRRRPPSPRAWRRRSRRRASPTTSPAIATRRRACASGAAPRSRPPTSRR